MSAFLDMNPNQIVERKLLPDGSEVQEEIIKAEKKIATTGRDMVFITLKAISEEGYSNIMENLCAPTAEDSGDTRSFFVERFQKFGKCFGIDDFDTLKNILANSPDELVGRTGWVIVSQEIITQGPREGEMTCKVKTFLQPR